MTYIKIREFFIKGEQVEKCSGDIYRKIGLKVKFTKNCLKIKSTKTSKIKSIDKHIHVNIHSIETIKVLMEEGFCCDQDDLIDTDKEFKMHLPPLEMVDELGNKIVASFKPKSNIRKIAVLTSGGDAPGMNCAIRAIVRTARKWGADVFGVYYGFDGLINDKIEELGWDSVGHHSSNGGTFLLSARSLAFMNQEGRKTATYNLVKRGIDGLVVMGGDGSIKGGMILREEFEKNVEILVKEGLIPASSKKFKLKLIAIPASIDNDISNSDMTLGADSCLHRVIECVDSLGSTMVSHQRSFVIEVMGRSCGWIALMAHFSVGAEYVFLPEVPQKNWAKDMINSIKKAKNDGKLGSFVIIAEGACDCDGNKIEANAVKKIIEDETKIECRVLKLGHIQRGGQPSAFDRILSTLLGCKAVEILLSDLSEEPFMVTLLNGQHQKVSLQKVLDENIKIEALQKSRNYKEVLKARGMFFNRAYALSEQLRTGMDTCKKKGKLVVIHNGERAGGMNAALHIIVRYAISLNQEVYIIQDGFDGLIKDQIQRAKPYDFISGISDGGSLIGSSIADEVDLNSVYKKLIEHEVTSLIVIGGSSSLKTIDDLRKLMKEKNNYCTNIILIPSTIDNNIPNTDMSLGADTALNCITKGCDFMRLSSMSLIKTVFVIEVNGEESGYLALFGGIASGAFDTFIPERKYMIAHLSECARRLKYRFKKGNKHGILLLKNESTFSSVSSDAFSKIITTDSEGLYNAKYCVLGDLVHGSHPSPYDRICATVLGIKSVDILLDKDKENILKNKIENLIGLIGLEGQSLKFTEIEKCLDDFVKILKREIKPAWLGYANICRSME